MGHCGTGKTTVYNKLCGTKHEAWKARSSLTRCLAKHNTSYGDYSFTVIDTPGDNAKIEKRKHALLLKHSITMEPVNAIFVLIEWNCRTD